MPLYYVFKDLEKRRGRKDLLQKKIKSLALNHFKQNAKILSKVFITNENQENHLHFVIALKSRSIANSKKIYGFIGDYYSTELSYLYPVDFQLIPKEFVNDVNYSEIVFEA